MPPLSAFMQHGVLEGHSALVEQCMTPPNAPPPALVPPELSVLPPEPPTALEPPVPPEVGSSQSALAPHCVSLGQQNVPVGPPLHVMGSVDGHIC